MKVLIFSDIHRDKPALERLMQQEADYYIAAGDLATFSKGLDELAPVLQPHADRVYVLPGNHESAEDIEQFCAKYGFHNFHCQTITADGFTIAGLGYSNITPFNTPGEYSEDELARRLQPFAGIDKLILICHCPPKDTKLDQSGPEMHFGSTAVRDFIDANQPLLFYCGHIHEAAGVEEQLGTTRGMNVGKRGALLDLESLVK